MPDTTTKAQIDLGGLTLHEGVPVLLRRALAPLAVDEWLEVSGVSPDFAEDLAMWCSKEGHHCHRSSEKFYRIQRGAGSPTLVVPGGEIAPVADNSWGLAPRG